MTTTAKVLMKFHSLSEDQRIQVLDFIDHLPADTSSKPSKLFGLFKGHETTEEEIAEARRDLWGEFPREDV
ncbi:MAG: hypothetical protein QM703_17730 [Gemmatales bacterium]